MENNVELEGNWFFAKDLLAALAAEGLDKAYVWQSGGNCATFWIQQEDSHMPFTAGPGSYNWTDSTTSAFTTDELYYSPDYDTYYEKHGEEVDQPGIAPGTTMADAAKLIADAYRKQNKLNG